jgi:hypothetical protein
MGAIAMRVPVPAGYLPSGIEAELTDGADGVAARFRAIGADEEYYELSLRVRRGTADETDGLYVAEFDAATRTLELGWSDAAGECALLAAYGHHLTFVRAIVKDWIASPIAELRRSGHFAEVRGRLATREDDGFVLQALRRGDPAKLSLRELNDEERRVWAALETHCMCPACVTRSWTEQAADALAVRIEAGDAAAFADLARCPVRTPALVRALMCAGAYPSALDHRLRRYAWSWGPRTLPIAAAVGRTLLDSKQVEARAAAIDAILTTMIAGDDTDATELVRKALGDKAVVAYGAMLRTRDLRAEVRAALIDPMLDTLTRAKNADLVRVLLGQLSVEGRAMDALQLARCVALLEQWASHKAVGRDARDALARLAKSSPAAAPERSTPCSGGADEAG